MSERVAGILLQDMLEAALKIERYTLGLGREEFFSDDLIVDAVLRNLEIIGEAARRIPAKFKSDRPEIDWTRISGLRNRIVHEYFGLDLAIIWQIVSSDLQALKFQLQAALSEGA